MARFYASIQGNRGEATRMGTAGSGIEGHIRGWEIGARVEVQPDNSENDSDVAYISATRGSHGARGTLFASLRNDPAAPDMGISVELADTPMMRKAAKALLES